ncbi:ABC transporter ATP-binding protein [Devosia aquimaris]|uniref:ABC transporter ATP-binding protein n=1 Tax=Devosia aquimaris TaxID=2866214 RepID=UPI001CD130B9|nr:ABC transporter ATP-binding protein [Devosia sp. CJK-A8-3]
MTETDDKPDWSMIWPPLKSIYGRFLAEERWMLAGVALVVLVSAVLAVATPYVFSRLIDQLTAGDVAGGVLLGFLAYALMRGVLTISGYSINYLSVIAAENLNFIAATQFFSVLLRKPGSFFIDHNPVAIQTARGQGQNSVYALLQLAMIVFIPGTAQIVLAAGLVGTVINVELMLIVAIYGTFFIGLTYLANRWTRPWLDRAITAQQDNARFMGNAVNAMETLRYFNGDRWISQKFSAVANLSRSSWVSWSRRRILLAGIFGGALAVQLAVTYWLLLPRYAAGELSVGDIVLINMILVQLNQPFEMIGTSVDEVMRAATRFMPFARMWMAPDDVAHGATTALVVKRGELRFEDVGFRYGTRQTVEDVSFVAGPGQLTFVTGPTGAGKSTLFKLALKSLEPTAGRIVVDGVDLKGIDRASWYEAVGVVPQDVMLLNDSLATNIVLGRPFDAARLRKAAAKASILAFIEGLPDGFETTVGERGLKLSGGERQRVSIARALYADPKVLFLDEASSALDEATEAAIMGELRRLMGGMTILAITHRRSVIGPDDQVIVLAADEQRTETEHENAATGQDGL